MPPITCSEADTRCELEFDHREQVGMESKPDFELSHLVYP